mgnify:CR=1 FL=1
MLHRPHKAQFTFLNQRISALAQAVSRYIQREDDFPYSSLYDLCKTIDAISQREQKLPLLKRLNLEVVACLYQHNPKLFPYYQDLCDKIYELENENLITLANVSALMM